MKSKTIKIPVPNKVKTKWGIRSMENSTVVRVLKDQTQARKKKAGTGNCQ